VEGQKQQQKEVPREVQIEVVKEVVKIEPREGWMESKARQQSHE
jgi:hypothetical protein